LAFGEAKTITDPVQDVAFFKDCDERIGNWQAVLPMPANIIHSRKSMPKALFDAMDVLGEV
jgi:hypothetical protein